MGKTTLILKCTIGCSVHLDGEFLTNLNQSEVKKVSIESGSHLLEFKTNYQTSTQIIQAVDGGNLVIFEEVLRKKTGIDDPVSLFGDSEDKERFIREARNIFKK